MPILMKPFALRAMSLTLQNTAESRAVMTMMTEAMFAGPKSVLVDTILMEQRVFAQLIVTASIKLARDGINAD